MVTIKEEDFKEEFTLIVKGTVKGTVSVILNDLLCKEGNPPIHNGTLYKPLLIFTKVAEYKYLHFYIFIYLPINRLFRSEINLFTQRKN